MSLSQSIIDQEIGMQTPSVPLTALQQQYLTNIGLPSQSNGSWLQVLQIESERRISDVTWAATLQSMPPASVEREIAIELALSNYLQFQIFKMGLQHTTITATQLAQSVERDFQPTVRMPAPSMAASNRVTGPNPSTEIEMAEETPATPNHAAETPNPPGAENAAGTK